jgi:hypothetical protein
MHRGHIQNGRGHNVRYIYKVLAEKDTVKSFDTEQARLY